MFPKAGAADRDQSLVLHVYHTHQPHSLLPACGTGQCGASAHSLPMGQAPESWTQEILFSALQQCRVTMCKPELAHMDHGYAATTILQSTRLGLVRDCPHTAGKGVRSSPHTSSPCWDVWVASPLSPATGQQRGLARTFQLILVHFDPLQTVVLGEHGGAGQDLGLPSHSVLLHCDLHRVHGWDTKRTARVTVALALPVPCSAAGSGTARGGSAQQW